VRVDQKLPQGSGPLPKQEVRLLATVLASVALILALHAGEPSDAEHTVVVSYTTLGPEVGASVRADVEFAASVDARPGFGAACAERKARSWHVPPPGVEPKQWVSVVEVGFRTRRDWLAFVFDGPSGSAALGVRRPAREVMGKVPAPGEYQLSMNAIKELAADFGHAYAARPEAKAGSVISVSVKPWKGEAAGGKGGLFEVEENEDEGLGTMTGGPMGEAQQSDLDGFQALGFGAACAVGWHPTAAKAERKLLLEVARGVNTYSVRATFTAGGRTLKAVKTHFPAEDVYVNLVRICLRLSRPGEVLDAHRMGAGGLQVLAWNDGQLVVNRSGTLAAYDPANGKELWSIPRPERGQYLYASHPGPQGEAVVYRYDRGMQRTAPDGSLQAIADMSPAAAWAFQTMPNGDLIVLAGNSVCRYAKGEKAWTSESKSALSAGPALAADRVVVGDEAGQVVCLALDDGRELWRVTLKEPLSGGLVACGEAVIGASDCGTIFALKSADGSFAWSAGTGDVLLAAVAEVNGHLLVASKDNVVQLLDPATGERKAGHTFDTWLLGVAPAGRHVVCTDLRGTVTFLSADDLRPVRRIALPARPGASILYAPAFPERWGGAEGMIVEQKPAVLVADEEGFMYVLSLPGKSAGRNTP